MEGILNLDKPIGLTSHDVVARVRRACGLRRVGHSGTLDPLATGVLVVCLGRATRLVEYLVGLPKTYVTTVRLGQTTTTYDAEGEVVAERPVAVDSAEFTTALTHLRGTITQRPPQYSAIKRGGRPLYELARRGVEVEVPLRTVTIYELTLLGFDGRDAQLRVRCSSGTYIRSLAHDLGEALGCGGHVLALRRTAVGDFTSDDALPLADLTADTARANLLPPDSAVRHLPVLGVDSAESAALLQGQRIPFHPTHPTADLARLYAPGPTPTRAVFIGLARRRDDSWQPHKIFHPDES